ncbi:MAG: SusC/RagA family TonB-linked outer membrane protein [Tannerellaceae bacterium]|nr:SusC/RagA family TonB-linked outer membrane protein [Tannerellaceae bacterium]
MKHITVFLFLTVFCLNAGNLNSQNARVSLNEHNVQLEKVLNEIEKQINHLFVYDKNVNIKQTVSINADNLPLEDILNQLFKSTNIQYTTEGSNIILSQKNQQSQPEAPQKKEISGTVSDSNGEPLIGVAVFVKGTTIGAQTDLNGSFSLSVPSTARTLSFTYVGMTPQDMAIQNKTILNITMQEASLIMDEVVVTALGIRKEAKSLSYNVQQLAGSDVNKVSDANFVNNLNGKVAGVTINASSTGAGGSARVVMRGVKSIAGNNNALYVIDGIPMPNFSTEQPTGVFEGAGQTGDGISNLNPEDIESISVLSGPSAAALYGSSASNGVVLITTKKGQKDRLSINVSNSTTFSRPLMLPKFQNTYGPSEVGSYYSWGEKLDTPSSYNPADFFRTGVNITNSVSLSTGTERNQTYVSVGNVTSNGIIHNNDYDRYNLSVRNTSAFLDNKMTMDLGFMLSNVKEQNMLAQGQYFNPLIPVYLFPPGDDFNKVQVYERYDASRNFQTQFWPYGDQGYSMQNPYWITERNKFINRKSRYMANATLKYEFAD